MCVLAGKTDPYVVFSLGDQVIRSKKNSRTTVIGPPGEPIWNQVSFSALVIICSSYLFSVCWNIQLAFVAEVLLYLHWLQSDGFFFFEQDFHLLVANPKKQRLSIQVKDSFGFADFTIGTGEVKFSNCPIISLCNREPAYQIWLSQLIYLFCVCRTPARIMVEVAWLVLRSTILSHSICMWHA